MIAYNPDGALALLPNLLLPFFRTAAAADPPRPNAPDAPDAQQTPGVSTSGRGTSPVAPPSSGPASNPEPSSVATTDRGTNPASPFASCAPTNAEPFHTAIPNRLSGSKTPTALLTSEVQSISLDVSSPPAPEQRIAEKSNLSSIAQS